MTSRKYHKHLISSNNIEDFKAHIKNQENISPKSKERTNIENKLKEILQTLDQNHISVIPDFCSLLKKLKQSSISSLLKNISKTKHLPVISNRFRNKTNHSEKTLFLLIVLAKMLI